MLLHSHVSWGSSLDFSLSATSADMFNKHEDPFPAQLWLFVWVHACSTVWTLLGGGEEK